MSNATHEDIDQVPAGMVWSDLWPAGFAAIRKGWSEQLRPGISLLLDESGEEATHWLAVLAGHAVPGRGRVQCAGLCSQADSRAYPAQVYWHNPRAQVNLRELSAAQWLEQVAQHWPQWSDAAWHSHCVGFELGLHMDKPLWHLSTGCLRKLGIAAALASGARLTLIEEPLAALDSNSIRYLCEALDALGKTLADEPQPPRWIVVAHWEPLAGVTWDEVLAPPALSTAAAERAERMALAPKEPVQQELL
jgi:ABC-type transport system involved in cytochrome c biogenesis ATPase subunit